MDVRIVAVAPEFEVLVERETWSATPRQQVEIDRLWQREQATRGAPLADTTVLAHVRADRRRLVGQFVRRRDVLAGRRAPQLFDGRPPVPVSVSALVTTRGRVVLGRRSQRLQAWPGRWELVPSCELDAGFHDPHTARIDVAGQLLAELVEQTPLPRPARAAVVPFALACCEREPCWSLCVALDLDLGEEALAMIEEASTPAYDAFGVVRPVDVVEAGLSGGEELVPLSAALVRLPRADQRAA